MDGKWVNVLIETEEQPGEGQPIEQQPERSERVFIIGR